MKNIVIFALLFFNSPSFSQRNGNDLLTFSGSLNLVPVFNQSNTVDDPCQKKLAKLADKEMFGDHDGYALIKGIEKLLKKCPKSALIHWAYAENLQEKGAFFDVPDWQNTSFIHYARAFKLDQTDTDYRWSYANMLEYIGQYYKASQQYEWLVKNDTIYRKDAKAHMITCNFLDKYGGGNKSTVYSNKIQPTDEELSDNEYFKKRTSKNLSALVTTTSIAGNIKSEDTEYNQIQIALGLLSDWENGPLKTTIAEQNDLFVAILATLSIIILEKGLNTKVGKFDFSSIKGLLSEFADKSISEEYRKNFNKLKPQEGRTFEIGNDLKITEKWSFSNLTGDYDCIKTSSSLPIEKLGWSKKEIVLPGLPGIMGRCVFVIDCYYSPFAITQNESKFNMVRETKTKSYSGTGDCGANAPSSTENIMTFSGIIKNDRITIESIFSKTTSTFLKTGETNSSTDQFPTGNAIIEILSDGTLKYSSDTGWGIYKRIK